MLEAFLKYDDTNNFDLASKQTLLAISGGIDSMVMVDLFYRAKFDFGIATCDFQLRGDAAKGDVLLVENISESYNIPFYKIAFDTKQVAKEKKQTIQVAARELRYEWLEKIRQTEKYDYIATAHHTNDSIETVIYNLSKGCGIRGLHGILPKNQSIIRPILFATKGNIIQYANLQKIAYRDDASNASIKYRRNYIRHEIIPKLKNINATLEHTFKGNIQRFRDTEILYDFAIQQIKKEVFSEQNNQFKIHIGGLKNAPAPKTVLYELLKPYGYNGDQVQQIFAALGSHSGKLFYSETHELLIDRTYLIGQPNKVENSTSKYSIQVGDTNLELPDGTIFLNIEDKISPPYPSGIDEILIDLEAITFPLTVRHWQEGDYIALFGGKRQKISKLFKNLKLTRFEKEKIWLVESAGKIVWVVNYRLDTRFYLKNTSIKGLRIRFKKNIN